MKTLTLIFCASACLLASACGSASNDAGASSSNVDELTGATASFTGSLLVSSTTATVGTPIVVTETATNLTANAVGPIIVGINRLGFSVQAVSKPRTGLCRIAGSATCNFVQLAPYETQAYTLTLVPLAAGTYQIKGWTTSSYVTGGASSAVTVTVN